MEGLGLRLGLAADTLVRRGERELGTVGVDTPVRRGERELGVGSGTPETPNSVLRCVAGDAMLLLRGAGGRSDVLMGSYSSSLGTALTIEVN